MAAYTKVPLSESTNGRGILVVEVGSAGDLIHTCHASAKDEIHLWAWNTNPNTEKLLTIEFGGTTALGDTIETPISYSDGLYLVVPGLILSGSVVVRAFAETTNLITIFGFVNRITA
jgi:hypothetical protein